MGSAHFDFYRLHTPTRQRPVSAQCGTNQLTSTFNEWAMPWDQLTSVMKEGIRTSSLQL